MFIPHGMELIQSSLISIYRGNLPQTTWSAPWHQIVVEKAFQNPNSTPFFPANGLRLGILNLVFQNLPRIAIQKAK